MKINIPDLNVNIDPYSVFAPLIAAQLTNAAYSALLLKHFREGKQGPEEDLKTLGRVIGYWGEISAAIGEAIKEVRDKKAS